MPTQYFKDQKKIGRWFEGLLDPVWLEMGFQVKDTDKLSYREKKGCDRILRVCINGEWHPCKVEAKFDLRSRETGRVYIDLDSINKSDSPIWVFGLPEGELVKVKYKGLTFYTGCTIQTYKMILKDLAPYALSLPRYFRGGEYREANPTPYKSEFLSQPFIKKLKTIQL